MSRCAWCSAPATTRDEAGDPICAACSSVAGPSVRPARDASLRHALADLVERPAPAQFPTQRERAVPPIPLPRMRASVSIASRSGSSGRTTKGTSPTAPGATVRRQPPAPAAAGHAHAFRCAALSCTLSTEVCAMRWRTAQRARPMLRADTGERIERGLADDVLGPSCRRCEIGATHAALHPAARLVRRPVTGNAHAHRRAAR